VRLQKPADDRVGNGQRVDPIFAATDLILNLIYAHGALPSP
jgi:hypothetical protein